MSFEKVFPPGSRVVIRDEEWLVRGNKSISTGGIALHVIGISELVRNHPAIFLSSLDEISFVFVKGNPHKTVTSQPLSAIRTSKSLNN